MPTLSVAYGVDLGTTFSAACFIGADSVEHMINPNSGAINTIPSCVCYFDKLDNAAVGTAAELKAKSTHSTLIYDSKRLIGKYYSDIIPEEIDSFPFECIEDDKLVKYSITIEGKKTIISPITISSEILKHINKISLSQITYNNVIVDDIHVVIGIPAVFKYHQREATYQAAKKAGLKNIELLTEPSAAALAYIQSNHDQIINKNDCNILVYDFGGGTFDVSIINLKDKEISVKVTHGDDHLGGQDITRRLEEYIKKDIKKVMNIDISKNEKLKLKIHNACDEAKKNLSSAEDAEVYMELSGKEYSKTITRSTLTNLCKDLFQRTVDVVNQTLNLGKMTAKDIDYIVLVGGSSRLPQVKEYINNNFKEIPISKSVNPDEAVAIGCGIYANYKLNGKYPFKIIDFIPPNPISFGIDLGTTFSCGAFYNYSSRNYAVISSGQSSNSIPSLVAFDKNTSQIKVGVAAVSSPLNKFSTVAEAKRYLNMKFASVNENDFKYNKYKLIEGKDGFCEYEVEYNKTSKRYTPVEISSIILRHIKEMAHPQMIGSGNVDKEAFPVVITVPADFSFNQRNDTIQAAKKAGLKVLHLINEPTAAAFAYISNNEIRKKNCNILVYDFGGGTFDVTIINLNGNIIKVLSTAGNNHLGGVDVTNRLCEYLISKVQEAMGGDELNQTKIARIRKRADEIKIELSSTHNSTFDYDDEDENSEDISREFLNKLCDEDLFSKTIKKTKQAIQLASNAIDDDIVIDYIVLVGGSSKIKRIEELISNNFRGIPICKSVNPDEAVAIGAALYARNIQDEKIKHYKIVDVLSRALGIEARRTLGGKVMTVIIKKCSALPASGSTIVSCKSGMATVNIFEGDGKTSASQVKLGSVEVEVRGSNEVEIFFDVSEDGILTFRAVSNGREVRSEFKINNSVSEK